MAGENLPEGTDQVIAGASADTGVAKVRSDPDEAGAGFDPSSDKRGGRDGGGGAASVGQSGGIADEAGDTTTFGGTAEAGSARGGEGAAGLAADWKSKAGDRAREYAVSGKDRAVDGLDNVSRLISDSAARIDEAVGAQYGDYARQAADAVSGYAAKLRERDVDDLFADARDVVRKSPGIAIGAAAAIGFVVARLVKAGVDSAAAAKEEAAAEERRATRKRA